jgi:hypothetical protein
MFVVVFRTFGVGYTDNHAIRTDENLVLVEQRYAGHSKTRAANAKQD